MSTTVVRVIGSGIIRPQTLPRYAPAESALSSACCCSLVRFVLSTVPPNLAISGNTRSWLVLRAITKSAEPPGWMAPATSLIHLSSMP